MTSRQTLLLLSFLVAIACLAGLTACSSDDGTGPPVEHPFEPTPPVNPQDKGDRLLGVSVSESSAGFAASFEVAQLAGIQVTELPLMWDAVETAEGQYQDPDGLLAATAFYGANDVQVLLTFAVINTVSSTVPDYLDGVLWNAPEMISAFNNMADWVMGQVPDGVTIVGVAIGNEVNYVLEGDQWAQYTEFFQATGGHFRTSDPGIPVGVKTTVYGGIFSPDETLIKNLNQHSDVIMLNYYQQDSSFQVLAPLHIHNNLTQLGNDFPGREIWLTEVGYQSGSEHCGSSESQQAIFFHELFTAWDLRGYQFKLLLVNWLHDQSAETIAEWEDYYGSSDPAFVEFLSTLGLRTHGGQDKDAWLQLLAETGARGWIGGD